MKKKLTAAFGLAALFFIAVACGDSDDASGDLCQRGAAYNSQCQGAAGFDVPKCEKAVASCSADEAAAIDKYLSCLEKVGCDLNSSAGFECLMSFPAVSQECQGALAQ